jgi:hypothetical protein
VLEAWLRAEKHIKVTVSEALTKGVKLDPDRQEPRHGRQVGASLRALGWIANTERVEGKVAKVFIAPENWHQAELWQTTGPQDGDVPF